MKAATGQPPTRLTTALELDVRRDAPSPVATSTVTAHVPADWPEVAALRERLRIARRTKAPFFAEDTQPPEDTERAREQLRGKWPGVGSDEALRQLHTQAVDALGCLFPRGEEHPVFGDERYASQLAGPWMT